MLASFLFIFALDYAIKIAIKDDVSIGFTLAKLRSHRYPKFTITDTEVADYLQLISDTLKTSTTIPLRLESVIAQVHLHINQIKTQFTPFNQLKGELITLKSDELKEVEDFLGRLFKEGHKKFKFNMAWTGLSKMNIIW